MKTSSHAALLLYSHCDTETSLQEHHIIGAAVVIPQLTQREVGTTDHTLDHMKAACSMA